MNFKDTYNRFRHTICILGFSFSFSSCGPAGHVTDLYRFSALKDITVRVNIALKINTASGPVLDFSDTPFVLNAYALDAADEQVELAELGNEPVFDLPVTLEAPTLSFDAVLRIPASVQPRDTGYALRFDLKNADTTLNLDASTSGLLSALRGEIQAGTEPESNQVDLSIASTVATEIARSSFDDPGELTNLSTYKEIASILAEKMPNIESGTDSSKKPRPKTYTVAIQAALKNQIVSDQAFQERIASKVLSNVTSTQDETIRVLVVTGFSNLLKDFVSVVDTVLSDSTTSTRGVFTTNYIDPSTLKDPDNYTGGVFAPAELAFTDSDPASTIGGAISITTSSVSTGYGSYAIYFGGTTKAQSKVSALATVTATGSLTSYTVPSGTAIPSGTSRFWVYPKIGITEINVASWVEISNSGPAAPASLTASASGTTITISWPASSGADSYNLYWSTAANVNKLSNKISSATSPYAHSGRTANTSYYYRVAALSGGVEGSLSSEASATALNYVGLTNGQAADVVVGQPDFTTRANTASRSGLRDNYAPGIEVTASGKLIVADTYANRVVFFNEIPTTNGADASYVLNQTSWTGTGSAAATGGGIDQPGSVHYDATSGKFLVTDMGHARVLLYNSLPTDPGSGFATATPAVSIGSTGVNDAGTGNAASRCTATQVVGATDAAIVDGKLLIGDYTGNRVLIYNSVPTSSGPTVDRVLGKANSTTCNIGLTASSSIFRDPASIWTDGTRLAVVSPGHHRVLLWNSFPTSDTQPADIVLGQADKTSTSQNRGGSAADNSLKYPYAVHSNGTQIFIADTGNCRVLVWNSWPTADGQAADRVVGQPDFISGSCATTQAGLRGPYGVKTYGNKLIVYDGEAGRIMIYNGQ